MLFTPFLLPALFVSSALAVHNPSLLRRAEELDPTGRYIVKLKNSASQSSAIDHLSDKVAAASQGEGRAGAESVKAQITHQYNKSLFNGFAGQFSETTLDALRNLSEVDYVVKDAVVKATRVIAQTNSPWGLQRISALKKFASTADPDKLTWRYTYDDKGTTNVDVYVIDTGVRATHQQFGGRARHGASFPSTYGTTDDNGHGTHCAGTVAGSRYGVAKKANIIGVKVLDGSGAGFVSDVIDGMNWVMSQAQANPTRLSVASMSLGADKNQALDDAVAALVAKNIHVVVAAGNNGADAGNSSPAGAPGAITVGATDITDAKAQFSNYGSVVDIFAPGVNVVSAWKTSNTATMTLDGTSMATPHVAGLVAYLLSKYGNKSPADMQAYIQKLGKDNIISAIPSGTNTRNDLARNDVPM